MDELKRAVQDYAPECTLLIDDNVLADEPEQILMPNWKHGENLYHFRIYKGQNQVRGVPFSNHRQYDSTWGRGGART